MADPVVTQVDPGMHYLEVSLKHLFQAVGKIEHTHVAVGGQKVLPVGHRQTPFWHDCGPGHYGLQLTPLVGLKEIRKAIRE